MMLTEALLVRTKHWKKLMSIKMRLVNYILIISTQQNTRQLFKKVREDPLFNVMYEKVFRSY